MTHVIVLNSDYTYLNTVSWQRAICLMFKGKAEVLKYTEKVVRNFDKTVIMKIPAVLKLMKLVRSIYKSKVPFSKRNVMVRDGFVCAYCGTKDKRLTIDHVIPVSKGGKTSFENCVAACKNCNSTKNDRIPSEAGMYLKRQPYCPTISEFIRLKVKELGIDDILRDLGVY